MRISRRVLPPAALGVALGAVFALSALSSCAVSCSSPVGSGSEPRPELAVMSYNVLSLFDAVDDGAEYPEFKVSSGRWDELRYRRRLENLAKVVREGAGARLSGRTPDVLCLLELENRRVLEDLQSGLLKSAGYRWAAMSPAPGAAINVGILSRLPIKSLRAHSLALSGAARVRRYVLEAAVDAGGSALTLLVCHWKSKLEGAERTEVERRQEAALVEGRVAELAAADPGAAIIVCGDFNENPDEYFRVGRRYATALMPVEEAAAPSAGRLLVSAVPQAAGSGVVPAVARAATVARASVDSRAASAPVAPAAGGGARSAISVAATVRAAPAGSIAPAAGGGARSAVSVAATVRKAPVGSVASAAGGGAVPSATPAEPVLYSPWAGSEGFSYAYKAERERIDGFLLSEGLVSGGNLSYRGFEVVDSEFLLDASGLPQKWSSFSATGYSDHLPILLRIELAPDMRR